MIRKNNRIRMALERLKKQNAVREQRNLLGEKQSIMRKNGLREEEDLQDGGEKYALLVSVGNYQKQNLVDLVTWKADLDLIQRGLTQGLKLKEENLRVLGSEGCVLVRELALAIQNFAKMLRKQDTFFFYFSGHGRNGELTFSDMGLALPSILIFIGELPCKNKIVILDCCYSGDFQTEGARQMSLEDSADSFAGHGMAILASSSANEVSRLDESGRYSLYTGIVNMAMLSRRNVRQGRLSLHAIQQNIQELMEIWNSRYPEHRQQPIFRSNIGGTVYFEVEPWQPQSPQEINGIHRETESYTICSTKPLDTAKLKRLSVFVIPKRISDDSDGSDGLKGSEGAKGSNDLKGLNDLKSSGDLKSSSNFKNSKNSKEIPRLTKMIVDEICGTGHYDAIWCYFGHDESDIIHHLYYAHSVWAKTEELRQMYFRASKDSFVQDEICVVENTSYQMLRRMREENQAGSQQSEKRDLENYGKSEEEVLGRFLGKTPEEISKETSEKTSESSRKLGVNLSEEEYVLQTKKILIEVVSLAEKFLVSFQEVANHTISAEEVKVHYQEWSRRVKMLYLQLSDGAIPPDHLYAWTEQVVEVAGCVTDLAILLEEQNRSGQNGFDDRGSWLMNHAVKQYYEGLEKLKEVEKELGKGL